MSTATQPNPMGLKQVLALAPVRSLWIAQIISVLGDYVALFAVFTKVSFQLLGTPAQVSLIIISFLLPTALVSPIAGVFVDRWHPKRTMISSDVIRAVLILWLVVAHSIGEIYAVFALLSLVSCFFAPAQAVVLRSLVPKEGLMSANALMMQAIQIVQIVVPVFAVLLYNTVGGPFCFTIDSVSFLASAFLVSRIAFDWKTSSMHRNLRSTVADLRAGMVFIFTHGALAFTILAMGAGLFAVRCFSALISVYVRDILHQNSKVYGLISTLVGVGMVVGSQFITRFARTAAPQTLILAGLTGTGVCILLLGLTAQVVVAFIATIGMGVAVMLIIVSAQTISQGATPIEMLGRVSSSMMAVMAAAQVGGMALSGSIAQAIGIQNSYLITSVLILLTAAAGTRFVRKLNPAKTPVAA